VLNHFTRAQLASNHLGSSLFQCAAVDVAIMPQLKRSVRTPLLKNGQHISQAPAAAAALKADRVSDIEDDDIERDPESEPESLLGDAPTNASKQKAQVGIDRKKPIPLGPLNNRRNATTRSSNPLVQPASRPMSIRQPNSPKSSAGNKRKRNNVPKGWETADELLDDEFTTIREASVSVTKVSAESPDQLDSVEFGSNLLGSQKTTYARSSQSSSQNMPNIHAKTGSQKRPREKKGKDSKIGQSDLGPGTRAIIDPGSFQEPWSV